MFLRAFAAHPKYRQSREALKAADLLKSTFFQPDVYSSYKDAVTGCGLSFGGQTL